LNCAPLDFGERFLEIAGVSKVLEIFIEVSLAGVLGA